MVGRLIARRMRSGTGLGPGICRKWCPVGWKSSVSMGGPRVVCSWAKMLGFRPQNCKWRTSIAALASRAFRAHPHVLMKSESGTVSSETSELLSRRLESETQGEVLFDHGSRGRYATDASIYQVMPAGVFVPRTARDVAVAIDIARDLKVPIVP